MNKIKNEKGITLIALVITIIILLILAGIVIYLTIGQNGILKMAESSVRNYTEAQEQESMELERLSNILQQNTIEQEKNEMIKLIEPMKSNVSVIGKCYYKDGEDSRWPAYRAFDNDISTDAASSRTNQEEDYLEYDFNEGVIIQKIEIVFKAQSQIFSNCKVTASMDGVNWDTIIETTDFNIDTLQYIFDVKEEYKNKTYRNVRIWQIGTRLAGGDNRMGVGEIQMYGTGAKWKMLIKPMESNISVIGKCYYKDGEDSRWPAYRAFDNDTSTDAASSRTNQEEDYLEYDFNQGVTIQKIEIVFKEQSQIFSNCKVTASMDGINWDTIIETSDFNMDTLQYIFDVKEEYKNKMYKNVRIWQMGTRLSGGDNRMGVGEIQMYKKEDE